MKIQTVGNKQSIRMTIATNYVYKGRDGEPVLETTWHNVSAWEGKNMPDFGSISKGDKIYVVGRIRNQRYTGNDGVERTAVDIQASRIQMVETDESLTYEQ